MDMHAGRLQVFKGQMVKAKLAEEKVCLNTNSKL